MIQMLFLVASLSSAGSVPTATLTPTRGPNRTQLRTLSLSRTRTCTFTMTASKTPTPTITPTFNATVQIRERRNKFVLDSLRAKSRFLTNPRIELITRPGKPKVWRLSGLNPANGRTVVYQEPYL